MRYYLNYSLPVIQQAIWLWLILALVALPLTWWGSRHLATRALMRRLGRTSIVLLYATGVVAYTLLPLPDRDTFVCPAGWGNTYPRFFLGWSLQFALREHSSLLEALFSTYILQMLLNILLFIPFGIFAYLFWKAHFRTVLLAAFGVSLVIELTQLTGLWGYYGCAIRTFDVEDLFNNTLGAVLGWTFVVAWQCRGYLLETLKRLFAR